MLKHYEDKGYYEVKISEKCRKHALYVAGLIERLFGVKPRVFREKGSWRVRLFRREVYDSLIRGISRILEMPDRFFVGGLFDAEGDYTASKKRLRLTNRNPEIIRVVEQYFSRHGVKCNVYKRRRGKYRWFVLEIYGSNAVKAFNLLELRHPKWGSYLHHSSLAQDPRRGWSG